MNNDADRNAKCSRCGTALGADAPSGLCPRCLLALNLSPQTELPDDAVGPRGTKVISPPPVPPTPAEIARHFPQLEILEGLGRGGMGVVYKARQTKLNRLVALKILAPERERNAQFAERFTREAQALARLNHPNIVAVYDFGEVDGLFYLLMEFVDGMSLRQLLQSHRVTPEHALSIVPKICEALQFAHQKGIVHRDIKPENILLDKDGQVKIADFGIAKMVVEAASSVAPSPEQAPGAGAEGQMEGANLTQDQVLGTPHYMAPEQVEQPQRVDHRADIYSLGVVFYEMLTGELPLGKFPPPSQKVHVDVRLDEVVLHALEREPERRYQRASEVKTAVEHIAASAGAEGTSRAAPARVAAAAEPLRRPALGLLLAGGLNALTFLVGLVGLGTALFGGAQMDQLARLAFLPGCLFLALSVVVVYGAVQMLRSSHYGWALAASIAALLIPSPFLFLALPLGIVALVRLTKPEIRAAFRAPESKSALTVDQPRHVGLSRTLLVGGGVALLVFLTSAFVTLNLPRSYVATARVGLNAPGFKEASGEDLAKLESVERALLASPPVLTRAEKKLNLAQRWQKRLGVAVLSDAEVQTLLSSALDARVRQGVSFDHPDGIRRPVLLEVRCYADTPFEAAEIANALAAAYTQVRTNYQAEVVDQADPPRRSIRPNVALNLAVGAALGLILGWLVTVWTRRWTVPGVRPTGETRAADSDVAATPKVVRVCRWTARVLSVLLMAFYGLFVLGEGLPPIAAQPEGVQLNFLALGLMMLGFLLGWKREGWGALLIASGWTLRQISEGPLTWNLFQTPLPIALLYAYCWWMTRGRRTLVIAGAGSALGVALGVGRLFCPANVFIDGVVTDRVGGQTITNAEVRLPRPELGGRRGKDFPQARSNHAGRFNLYVGWYSETKVMSITAPGYEALTTTLGPRALGQRRISRRFQLQPSEALSAHPTTAANSPQANAAAEIATLRVQQAEREFNRVKELQAQKLASPWEYDRARLALDLARREQRGETNAVPLVRVELAKVEFRRASELLDQRIIGASEYHQARASLDVAAAELRRDPVAVAEFKHRWLEGEVERAANLYQKRLMSEADYEKLQANARIAAAELKAAQAKAQGAASTNGTSATRPVPAEELGPATERVIAHAGPHAFLDLDSGQFVPYTGPQSESGKIPEGRIDVYFRSSLQALDDLATVGMVCVSLATGEAAWAQPPSVPTLRTVLDEAAKRPSSREAILSPSTLHAFRTREGAWGLIQSLGANTNWTGVRVRYRLVETGQPSR